MKKVALLLATLALGGCAVVDRIAPSAESTAAVPGAGGVRSNAEDLVGYLVRLRPMSETALAAEAARHKRDSSDLGKVKAAMALSLNPQSEESDIIALVEATVKKENADRDVRAMASFLHTLAAERRRLKESVTAASARLREERRVMETQKQRADALQQKLDALTELEKSLSDRPAPSR
jgi:pyrroloquinoline quinone (PQQ) biosynthesis protein C